jgi:hypothetical protein
MTFRIPSANCFVTDQLLERTQRLDLMGECELRGEQANTRLKKPRHLQVHRRVSSAIRSRARINYWLLCARHSTAICLFIMEHKGIEFTVVQAANPLGWIWTVHLPGNLEKTGRSRNRPLAVARAQAVIDDAVANAVAAAARGNRNARSPA